MAPLEMRLGREIAEEVEQKGMTVFRNNDTGQPYALFKLEDKEGAVVSPSENSNMYIVYTVKKEDK